MKFFWARAHGPLYLKIKKSDGQIVRNILVFPILFLGFRIRRAKRQIKRIKRKLEKADLQYKAGF